MFASGREKHMPHVARNLLMLFGGLASLALLVHASASRSHEQPIQLIGRAEIPGDAIDASGLTDILPGNVPHNRFGSFGSGIAYTGQANRYLMTADRGPHDGTAAFRTRVHELDIAVAPTGEPAITVELKRTILLKNERGESFVGNASAFNADHPAESMRLDAEGIRISPSQTIYLSDEYGPYIYEFDRQGKRLRSFPVPKKFTIATPHADGHQETALNKSGRVTNRGLEGLAITPDGSTLVAIMQSPLIQDGGRAGANCRILQVDVASGHCRELVYVLDQATNGVNEMLALNDHEFLVIERDGKGGADAVVKKLFKVDLSGASEVSGIDPLPAAGLPTGIKAVQKTLFLDLLDPQFHLAGARFPAKIEGLAFGPDLPDGRHLLLVTSDNDFVKEAPTWILAFAIDPAHLPGFQAQVFPKELPQPQGPVQTK
jgi:hypothetical protein